MSYTLISNAEEVAAFVSGVSGMKRDCMGRISAVGIKDGDEIIGGVVYERFLGSSIEMHAAGVGKRWLTRPFLRMIFAYPFKQLQCKVVYAMVPCTNTRSIAFNLKIGFTIEHVLQDALPEGPLYLMSMRREACRYLEI